MTAEKIKEVTELFAKEVKRIYGNKLQIALLYGSCARGDYEEDSDIDILLLLKMKLKSKLKMQNMFMNK